MISFPIAAGLTMTRVLQCGLKGPAVLFLHGIGARADRWASNIPAVGAKGYRAFAVDLPGHGFAEKTANQRFSAGVLTRFILEVLDVLDCREVILVGTSFGGQIAMQVAARVSSRVRALVLIGSLGLAPLDEAVRQRMADGLRSQNPESICNRLKRLVLNSKLISEEWIEEEYRVNSSSAARDALAALADYIVSPNGLEADSLDATVLSVLSQRIPTLLAWGEEDRSVPLHIGEAARMAAPRAEWAPIPNAAHLPYLENPHFFNEKLLAFFDRHQLR